MKQRTKPCKECPFRKDNVLTGPNPGGSPPEVYVGQSQGPFWLPCHMEKAYDGKDTDPHAVSQCAGAAIYRANLGLIDRMPAQILRLPEDKESVFTSHVEFMSHYTGTPVEEMEEMLSPSKQQLLLLIELYKTAVKRVEL